MLVEILKRERQRKINNTEWWAEAAMRQKEVIDPFDESPAFSKSPSQQNTPSLPEKYHW